MSTPANSAAEIIVQLQTDNVNFRLVIENAQAAITRNEATISELTSLAKWDD